MVHHYRPGPWSEEYGLRRLLFSGSCSHILCKPTFKVVPPTPSPADSPVGSIAFSFSIPSPTNVKVDRAGTRQACARVALDSAENFPRVSSLKQHDSNDARGELSAHPCSCVIWSFLVYILSTTRVHKALSIRSRKSRLKCLRPWTLNARDHTIVHA